MSFKAPIFTNKGKQLYASCLAGKNEIIFTNIKLGDGELMAQAVADLEDLVNPIKTIVLNDKKLIGNDQVLIRAVFKNIDISSGFYWREVGLYAQDPENPEDRSKDILFCYQNAGDTAEYIPSASSGLIDKILSMSLVVSDVNSVNVSFFSESYALKEDLDEQIAIQAQALDNHKKDVNAHSELFSQFVKKSGDTMSGALVMSDSAQIFKNKDDHFLGLYGGSNYNKGAFLEVYGKDHAEQSGNFNIYANNDTQSARLNGTPNGSLTWQGHNIATTNGIKMQGHILKDTDDSELIVGGATVFNNGAYGAFRGVNFGVAEEAGSFAFKAQGDKQYFLKGTKDGSLKWDDKNLVRSVNGINADNSGNVTINALTLEKTWTSGTSGYRVYSDGFCEQWGSLYGKKAGMQVTFAIPYKDTNYSISHTQGTADNDSESGADAVRNGSLTTTGFIVDRYASIVYSYWHTWGYIR